MTGFVDPTNSAAVEEVLVSAVPGLGLAGVLESLAAVPGLQVRPWRAGGLLRKPVPAALTVEDRRLSITHEGEALLEHIVGGVVLSKERVRPRELPGVLAALIARSVPSLPSSDQLSVTLTSIRDALV